MCRAITNPNPRDPPVISTDLPSKEKLLRNARETTQPVNAMPPKSKSHDRFAPSSFINSSSSSPSSS